MKTTHLVSFFSNDLNVSVKNNVVVEVEDSGFAPVCPTCSEDIVGRWYLNPSEECPHGLELVCPTDNCDSWPAKKIKVDNRKNNVK